MCMNGCLNVLVPGHGKLRKTGGSCMVVVHDVDYHTYMGSLRIRSTLRENRFCWGSGCCYLIKIYSPTAFSIAIFLGMNEQDAKI